MALTSVKTLNSDCNSAPMLTKVEENFVKISFFGGFQLVQNFKPDC